MSNIIFENPLQWKPHIEKTKNRKKSQFKSKSASFASIELVKQLRLMGAKNCVITSNMILTKDKSRFMSMQPNIEDTGVSVFFELKGQSKVMQIDLYDKVEDNMWAIYKSVEALRGLNRWGGAQIMDGMFTGFNALPSPDQVTNNSIAYFSDCHSKEQARERYLRLAKELHPDLHPESAEEFKEMKRQYEQIK